jgi:ribosome-binding factor A
VTTRIPQVNELLKRELADSLLDELDLPEGEFVTVTRVEATGNLQQAKVYISVMPEEQVQGILEFLERHVYQIQQKLNKRLNMRPVPRIQFVQEKKSGEAQNIEALLERIKNK